MLQSNLLMTVSECDTAIAKATEEKVSYEARKYSLNRQIPHLEDAQDVAVLIANAQSDIAGLEVLIASALDEDMKDSLIKKRNNFQNRLIDLQNRSEVSVVSTKVDKHLALDIAEAGIAITTAALTAYQERKAELVAANAA